MKMSAIFATPIAVAAFRASKSRKLGFGGEFRCQKLVSWSICSRGKQRIMKGCDQIRAKTRGEGVPGVEQEECLSIADGGIEASINNMSKWLVAAALGAMCLWRHDGGAVWAVLGSVFNDEFSITLKKILNQERPDSTLRSDPGMPSSHAQTISYTTWFIILSIVELYGVNAQTSALSGLIIVLGSYLTWLRISQNFHTVSQVVVGAIVGSFFSFLWFWSWKAYVLDLFVSVLWVRLLIIVASTGFLINRLYYTSK